jgi:hypothetical protein
MFSVIASEAKQSILASLLLDGSFAEPVIGTHSRDPVGAQRWLR